jgi:hypothetical protein
MRVSNGGCALLQVLGGRVEALAAAWEVQRQYGGLKERPPGGDDEEKPVPFRHFIPGWFVRGGLLAFWLGTHCNLCGGGDSVG